MKSPQQVITLHESHVVGDPTAELIWVRHNIDTDEQNGGPAMRTEQRLPIARHHIIGGD